MTTDTELDRVAEQYRGEGYSVVARPDATHLSGVGDVTADLIATRGGETVLIRVARSRADVESDRTLSQQAAVVNARPGWRYDLVVLEKGPTERPPESVVEPTDEQFVGMLDHARQAAAAGFKAMALTHACAALEAAMRRAREDSELFGPVSPTGLLSTLYANGVISRAEFDRARAAWVIRNQAVHGFVAPEIDPALIADVLSLAEKVSGAQVAFAGSVA